MKFFLGATDREWFRQLRAANADEVNFWKPGAPNVWNSLKPGEPFLFKLREAPHVIGGGGFFLRYSVMPTSIAWKVFERKNGTRTLEELQTKIRTLSGSTERDPQIGCIVLSQVFYFDDEEMIPVNNYRLNGPGAGLDSTTEVGAALWRGVTDRLEYKNWLDFSEYERFQERTILQRVGQSGFRVLVMEAYNRRCAITGERTLPVLQASHIVPYTEEGKHIVSNGLFLRSDVHTLFDAGYLTITPDLQVEVSKRIREEYSNGREYYALHGQPLISKPSIISQLPDPEFLRWHNDYRFVA